MDVLATLPRHASFQGLVATHLGAGRPGAEEWVVGPAGDEAWIEVASMRRSPPRQGWKLHVAATAASAAEVLARALPVLGREAATFKVAASPLHLERLNQGLAGASQVGKFLTVYPVDDVHAVRLATALDEATSGLAGPRIRSDRQLRPDSLVHYRYGAFEPRWLQLPTGEVVAALEAPDGALVPDERRPMFRVPDWASDPFVGAGVAISPPPVDLLVADRYLTVALLNNSARTAVRLALDIETGERRVLKHARRAARFDEHDGAFLRLRREADILTQLAHEPFVPALHGLIEDGSDLYLVTEHCEGPTLEQHVRALAVQGRLVPRPQVVAWARELAEAILAIHGAGFVYGDLKPSNVIVSPRGLRLVDFETMARPHAPAAEHREDGIVGTLGFLSPQRIAGEALTTADDVYAFGALLVHLLTGADPSEAPHPLDLLARPLRLLDPDVPTELEALVAGCLRSEPARRVASMADLRAALARVETDGRRGRHGVAPATPDDRDRIREQVTHLCSALRSSAALERPRPGQAPRRDLHDGAAGLILTLAEACGLPDTGLEGVVRSAARSLAGSSPLRGGPLPGLYVGEAGIGAALLRAGVALHDDGLVAAACDKGRLVARLPHTCPDLHAGTAGRIRFHLALAGVTGEAEHVRAAIAAGTQLLSVSEGPEWPMPAGWAHGGGTAFLGYAHGSAGIADALLDLFEATGEERFARAGRRVALALVERALPALDDGSGLDWPISPAGEQAGPFWCHGAAGVGRFLLRAARLTPAPGVLDTALAAAKTATRGARWSGPGQCHGLAGNAELLLDVYTVTGDRTWLDEAFALTRLIGPFVDGLDDPGRVADGFANGRAGILACLLRFTRSEPGLHVLDLHALAGPTPDRPCNRRAAGST